jgi:hypothetical protein
MQCTTCRNQLIQSAHSAVMQTNATQQDEFDHVTDVYSMHATAMGGRMHVANDIDARLVDSQMFNRNWVANVR